MGLNRDRGYLSLVPPLSVVSEPDFAAATSDIFRKRQQSALLTGLLSPDIDLEEFSHIVTSDDPVHGLLESIKASGKQEPEPLDAVTIVIDPTDRHSPTVKADALHIDLPSRGGPEQFLGTIAILRLSQPQGDVVGLFGIPDPDAPKMVQAVRFFRQTADKTYEQIRLGDMPYWHEGEDSKPEDFLRNAMSFGACSTRTITATKVSFLSAEDFGGGPDGNGGIPAPTPLRRNAA